MVRTILTQLSRKTFQAAAGRFTKWSELRKEMINLQVYYVNAQSVMNYLDELELALSGRKSYNMCRCTPDNVCSTHKKQLDCAIFSYKSKETDETCYRAATKYMKKFVT